MARAHHWLQWKPVARPLCLNCGLLWLRNDASERTARKPCPGNAT